MRREELTQFECHLCGEGSMLDHFQKCSPIIQAESTQILKDIPSGHYHTKRKLQLLELPGYQFADPCPPSVRSVPFSILPVVVFIMFFCSVEDLWSLWSGYSLEVPDQGFSNLDLICTTFLKHLAISCNILWHLDLHFFAASWNIFLHLVTTCSFLLQGVPKKIYNKNIRLSWRVTRIFP